MKSFIIFLSVVFVLSIQQTAYNQQAEKYSQVRIYASDKSQFESMLNSGLIIDHAVRKNNYTDAWLSASEIEMLKQSGVGYEVLIPDWKRYYDNLPKMTPAEMDAAINNSKNLYSVSHSIYGTMGGFLKYSEVSAKLDSMRLQYPGLISAKFSIGTTGQGRQIWAVRVSNSPDAPTGRPEVLYHALIHAREPESMEHMMYFMYWLFENYNIDPLATYILKNRELYFIPVFNPDGYVYNESTNPNGGGMWRKNRRSNAGGSFGIDLNRNYGTYQYWNSSNNGSSTSGSSDTYRGTSPFSENETQAVMNFVNGRNFSGVLGSHTYGNYLIKPWAWQDPTPTPDDNKFNEYLADMTKFNHYTTGTPSQTVGYYVRGSADDWYYNDSAHSPHHIIAMTPETGTTGFWPTQAEIIPLAEGMLFANQYFAMIGGAYVYPLSTALNKSVYSSGESGTLKIKFRNKGVQSAQNVKIECTSGSFYLTVPISFYNYPSLGSFQSDSSNFGFTVSPLAPNNSALPVNIKFYQSDSSVIYQETKYILIGNGTVTFADSAENGFGKWTSNQGWATTTSQSHTPSSSFTDSPSGNYANNANNSMTMNLPLNISLYPVCYLSFWHRYATEAGYDFCIVEVSSDNGATWQSITSYNGTLSTWTFQSFDITSQANSSSQLKVRFRLQSDAGVVADGWYVDDIKLTNYNPQINAIQTNVNITIAPEGLYNSQANNLNIRDSVRLVLRNANSPYAAVDSSKRVIDSTNFTSNFTFTNNPSGNYYLQMLHRNSIETWSKSGGEVYTFGGTLNYNFTTASSQAYGNNEKQIGSKYCIFSGDVDQDGNIDVTDLILINNDADVFTTGYIVTDLNGDYIADISDLVIAFNNAQSFVIKITP